MAGRAGNGVEIDLDLIPRRAKAMTPYEILLSESQERMLLVAKPGKEDRVLEVCRKWDLDAAVIGKVTNTKRWVVKATAGYDPLADDAAKRAAVIVCDLPIGALTDDAPVYDRPRAGVPAARPAPAAAAIPSDLGRELLDLIGSPNVGSRAWVWKQYDQIVRGGTVVRPGSDAGIVRVPCERDGKTIEKLLAFACDCNGRMCELDAYEGAAMAVAEACRNLVCSGAEPIGLTDCLNFGNPERPEVMQQFARAVDGIAAACEALSVPIVSGNVSLYNDTDGRSILPTPVLGAVGLVRSRDDVVRAHFRAAGDAIWLLGDLDARPTLHGSEWLVRTQGTLAGTAPRIDLVIEARLQRLVLELAREHVLRSAHDVADGGLAVAIAECCAAGPEDVGANVELYAQKDGADALGALFGEMPTRVVVSVAKSAAELLAKRAADAGVPAVALGETTSGSGAPTLSVTVGPLGSFTVPVADLRARREACLEGIVDARP
jgi:phosphoribosylformylglycinamidine synthase subunit PurL